MGELATLADLFLPPTMTTLSLTPEGAEMLDGKPLIRACRERMRARASAMKLMADVAPTSASRSNTPATGSRRTAPDANTRPDVNAL